MSSSSSSYSEATNSQIYQKSLNTTTSTNDDHADFIDEDDDDDSVDQSIDSSDSSLNRKPNKKTLGRVKIKMAYIDNKVRRYTTFSKRKTGIMKKAYELATLTGTEVMLLVASETGHVYTYATPKLQPMITSEAGKTLIQTCLEKDELPSTPATLNNSDVIFVEENQRKKRPTNDHNSTTSIHPIKRAKLKSSEEIKPTNTTSSCPSPTANTLPLSCFINPDSQQQSITGTTSFTIDLNSLKTNGMNVVFTPSSPHSSRPSPSSNVPLMLTFGHFPS